MNTGFISTPRKNKLLVVVGIILMMGLVWGCEEQGTATVVVEETQLPTQTNTEFLPTNTTQPIDTPTPEPTDTPVPTDTPTPEPTETTEPTPTSTARDMMQISDKPRLISYASDAEIQELVAGNSAFAFDLYQKLIDEEEGNLIFSPYSISLALAMTYAGARTDTEKQMADTMHYTLPQETLHAAFNALDSDLTKGAVQGGEDDFQLHIANAIWGQDGYEFLPEYLDTLAKNYGAGLRTLDFAKAEDASEVINDWVIKQTEGKIQDVISPEAMNALTRLVLANAIYFNGKWYDPFDEGLTGTRDFYILDGNQFEVDMMEQEQGFQYAEGDGYQAAQLDYRDSSLAMLLILPDIDLFEEFEESLSLEIANTIAENLSSALLRLYVPKYSFESTFSLEEQLQQMGMPDAFSEMEADFSGMTENLPPLFIGGVLHKAFVEVNEGGTEAAAATIVEMEAVAAPEEEEPEKPIVMMLDHPFLFLIRDRSTGTILFIGRVLAPDESAS